MQNVGLVVYQVSGTHYCTFQVGGTPAVPIGAETVFRINENVDSAQELFQIARKKANDQGIGKIVNLPD